MDFIGADQYMGTKDAITIDFIIMEHIRRIGTIASKEWHGGKTFWQQTSPNLNQDLESKYLESSAEAYTNAINYLFDLLLPKADEELLKAEEKYSEAVKRTESKGLSDDEEKKKIARLSRRLFRECLLYLKRTDYFRSDFEMEFESV